MRSAHINCPISSYDQKNSFSSNAHSSRNSSRQVVKIVIFLWNVNQIILLQLHFFSRFQCPSEMCSTTFRINQVWSIAQRKIILAGTPEHRLDSNQGTDYIAIFLSYISLFLGINSNFKRTNWWRIKLYTSMKFDMLIMCYKKLEF